MGLESLNCLLGDPEHIQSNLFLNRNRLCSSGTQLLVQGIPSYKEKYSMGYLVPLLYNTCLKLTNNSIFFRRTVTNFPKVKEIKNIFEKDGIQSER